MVIQGKIAQIFAVINKIDFEMFNASAASKALVSAIINKIRRSSLCDEIPISEICTVKGGFAFKSKDFHEEGIPLIRIGNIGAGIVRIYHDTPRLPTSFVENYGEFVLKSGDLVVALSGATTGKSGIFLYKTDGLLNQRVGRFSQFKEDIVDPTFFRHYISEIEDLILHLASGSAQPNISTSDIGKIKIQLPSINIQRKYSKIIGNLERATLFFAERSQNTRQLIRSVFSEQK